MESRSRRRESDEVEKGKGEKTERKKNAESMLTTLYSTKKFNPADLYHSREEDDKSTRIKTNNSVNRKRYDRNTDESSNFSSEERKTSINPGTNDSARSRTRVLSRQLSMPNARKDTNASPSNSDRRRRLSRSKSGDGMSRPNSSLNNSSSSSSVRRRSSRHLERQGSSSQHLERGSSSRRLERQGSSEHKSHHEDPGSTSGHNMSRSRARSDREHRGSGSSGSSRRARDRPSDGSGSKSRNKSHSPTRSAQHQSRSRQTAQSQSPSRYQRTSRRAGRRPERRERKNSGESFENDESTELHGGNTCGKLDGNSTTFKNIEIPDEHWSMMPNTPSLMD